MIESCHVTENECVPVIEGGDARVTWIVHALKQVEWGVVVEIVWYGSATIKLILEQKGNHESSRRRVTNVLQLHFMYRYISTNYFINCFVL
mgnify:CR=1 FL=1